MTYPNDPVGPTNPSDPPQAQHAPQAQYTQAGAEQPYVVPVVPAGPGWGRAIPAWGQALSAAQKGDAAKAADTLLGSSQSTGNPHALWIVSATINGLLSALITGVVLTRMNDGLGVFGAEINVWPFVFLALLSSFLLLVGRAAAVIATTAVRGRRAPFAQAASLAALPFVGAAPIFGAFLLFVLIPGRFTFLLIVLAWVYVAFLAETTLYIAIARWGRFAKSPTLPHALFSTAWVAVSLLVIYLFATDLFAQIPGMFR